MYLWRSCFEGRMLRLDRDIVRLPNGFSASREVIKHPGAVAIIALHDQHLLMVRQYRYAIGQETLEIPAGELDPQEEPLDCAERELREETGYRGLYGQNISFPFQINAGNNQHGHVLDPSIISYFFIESIHPKYRVDFI